MIKYKAKNSLKSPRFAGVKTFMRMEHVVTTDDIDFAVVGIPYDTCASFRVGTRLGPAAIRDASALAAKPFNGPLNVGIFDWCSGVDYGDLGSVPGYIEESFELITEGMLPFFEKGIVPVAMGGDHSVTLPELRACAKVNGPVALIHFDAHYDTIHEYFGKPYNHGTPFYHAAKEGLVDTSKSIQVGIREGLYGPGGSDQLHRSGLPGAARRRVPQDGHGGCSEGHPRAGGQRQGLPDLRHRLPGSRLCAGNRYARTRRLHHRPGPGAGARSGRSEYRGL